ncbi:MAG: tetratricopeptide repeat protein, partial [Planctomycetota bacterium]|nr:tetratricopeptide repeat protein [Planctomycetota bacterium]
MPKGKRKRAAASDGSMAVADQPDRGRRPCTGGNARPGRKIGLPVVSGSPPPLRESKTSRWRAVSLVLVHLAMIAHFTHWWYAGETLTPIEPSESMYTFRDGAINAGIIFFGLAIAATFVVGRFFCGWGCHLIAYQDLTYWLLKKLGIRPKSFRSRFLMFIPFAAAFYMFGIPIINRYWTAHSHGGNVPPFELHLSTTGFWDTFAGPVVAILTVLFCGVALIYFVGAKGFCTYACPYGAFFGVADRFARGRIRVTDACEGCGHCTATCTSNVNVAEEVARFGMVVDPGCMKCMDCVSVCPNDALYFGFGPVVKGASRKRFDLSLPEEFAALVIFAVFFLAFRGIYGGRIPFLFSLAIAGIGTFVILKGTQLLHKRTVLLQKIRLKANGRLRPVGWAFAGALLVLSALTAHSAFWQYHDYRGGRYFARSPAAPLGWQYDPGHFDRVPDDQMDAVRRGLRHLTICDTWGILDAADNHRQIAWMALHAGDRDRAISHVERLVDSDPSNPMAWINLASLHTACQDTKAAQDTFKEALSLEKAEREQLERKIGTTDHPLSSIVWLQWAMFLEFQHKLEKAADAYRNAVAFDSRSSDSHASLGRFEMERGNTGEARRLLIRAVGLDPNNPTPSRFLMACGKLDGQDFEAAAADYAAAIDEHGNVFQFQRHRAYALAQLSRFDDSLAVYRAALADRP